MKSVILKLIVSLTVILWSNFVFPNPCDTLDLKVQRKFDKYPMKKMRQLLIANDNRTDEWFLIAEYLRHKGDTTCMQWYRKITFKLTSSLKGDTYDGRSNAKRTKLFYILGVSYYYLENYKQAEKWFSAVLTRTSNNHFCAGYYLNQIELMRPNK